jgi:PAS domain S-box-containing protein
MQFDPFRHGLRYQLLGLFGLILLAGVLLLGVEQVEQYTASRALESMRSDALAGVRHTRRLADAYGRDITNAAYRTRNEMIGEQQAGSEIDDAQAVILKEWTVLQQLLQDDEERVLLEQALLARPRADEVTVSLREVLRRRDFPALNQLADHELHDALEPLLQRLTKIESLELARADALAKDSLQQLAWVGWLRLALALLCLLLIISVGWRILYNAFRGVESLAWLAQRHANRDFKVQPRYVPKGELGDIQQSILTMREHIRKIEEKLSNQLINNEKVHLALERREQFQRLLLEAAQTAIFAVGDDGVFTQINPFAEQLLGWPAGSLLGRKKLDAILDHESVKTLSRSLSEAYGRPVEADWTTLRELARHHEPPREFALRHQRGRTLPVLLALSAMRDDNGSMVGLLAVATDLTQIKRLERALRDSEVRARDANRAKSAFLAAMSHEIRTPMIGVTGMIEVLAHTELDPEQRRSLGVVQASAETLLRIIGDILDFSKIEAGKMEIEPVPIALTELIHSVTANFSGSASSKGLVLSSDIDPQLAPAYLADPVRLRQVIGNFLSNAIKFTERGGVTVAAKVVSSEPSNGELGSDQLLLQVIDTGIGISAQAQARLFQPFAQAEADTTRRFGGTGLGLAISRRIAELMGGSVEMESEPGRGTSMQLKVTLPRANPNDVQDALQSLQQVKGFAPRSLPADITEAERDRSLVLLVDDHATNRQVIQRQLALAGYLSEVAEDGEEGLQAWRSGRYALVLTDVHMPRRDGYQLAQAIRDEERGGGLPRTPVVALTAAALKGEAEKCLAAGMDDYLAKPVGIPALGACLQRWLPHTAGDSSVSASQQMRLQAANNTKQLQQPEQTAVPVLSHEVLLEVAGDDLDSMASVLDDYLHCTSEDLDELDHLLLSESLQDLVSQAHRIKGAAKLVGAMQLAATAADLEAAARRNELPLLPLLTGRLHADFERLNQHLGKSTDG